MNTVEQVKAEAKQRGIAWSWVLEACKELRAEAAAAAEHANEVRKTAWTNYTAKTPWAHPFWRIGFLTRFGKRVDAADYKVVPGFDVLAAGIAEVFPEFSDDAGCERLWTFLLSPYKPLPKRAELLARALDRAAAAVEATNESEALSFGFGANVAVI